MKSGKIYLRKLLLYFEISGAVVTDSGLYRCSITDGFSTGVFTDSAQLTVQEAILSFVQEPQNALKFVGDSVTLEAEGASSVSRGVLYQWQKLSTNGSTYIDIKNS